MHLHHVINGKIINNSNNGNKIFQISDEINFNNYMILKLPLHECRKTIRLSIRTLTTNRFLAAADRQHFGTAKFSAGGKLMASSFAQTGRLHIRLFLE